MATSFCCPSDPAFISADILTAILALYSTVKIFEVSPLLKEQTQARYILALKHNTERRKDTSVEKNNNSKFLVNPVRTV